MQADTSRGLMALELLDTAVIRLDPDGCVLDMNPAAEQCIGAGRERARGRTLESLTTLPPELNAALGAMRDTSRRRHLQELHMGGGSYDCSIQAVDGGGLLLELHDLQWERQRMKLQQRELQSGLMELLSRNLGHEIRNPLGGIRGAAQMLAKELDSELELPEMATLARMIMRESDRIEELIARFGRPALEPEETDFYPLLDEVLEPLRAEFGAAVSFERDFDPSVPPLMCDRQAVRQILHNLLRNACQAKARNITLRTRIVHDPALLQTAQAALRVDVDDDGAGVPGRLRPLLFLPMVTGRRDGT
ncbi:MAG: histidine kinase dimerization/phospho-acceptor domain-containing protein, partial [Xanthomonadales bacterium]|nr:histidine kinase dimerization/phospho-acceptor domain-containing protein [Xanthomonadales bacterium]